MATRRSSKRGGTSRKKATTGKSSTRKKGPKKVGGRRLPARTSSAREAKKEQELVRLNKFLADHGVASRRACDELIAEGKVMVDGEPVTELGTKVDPHQQVVEVDGVRLEQTERRYYLLHKPPGVVCTNEVRETRPRAVDLVTDPRKGRIYTVGRLDEESRGLLLLTNDGEFAERIAHPRFGVAKTYQVRVIGRLEDEALEKLRSGVHLAEGKTAPAWVRIKRRTLKWTTLTVTLREGKNREVRRIFARVGYKVADLQRSDIGPLSIRGLRVGHWRALSRAEVEALLVSAEEGADDSLPPPAPGAERARSTKASSRSGTRRTAGGKPAGKKRSSKKFASKKSTNQRPGSAKPGGKKTAGAKPGSKKASGKKAAGGRAAAGGALRRMADEGGAAPSRRRVAGAAVLQRAHEEFARARKKKSSKKKRS